MNGDARCRAWRGMLLAAAFAAVVLAAVAPAGPVARAAGPAGPAGAQAVPGGSAAGAQAGPGAPAAGSQAVPGAPAAAAQAAPGEAVAGDGAPPGRGSGSIEAIRCWRRVGRNAVYVGERFDLLVTCSVAETAAARVVPDLAGLEPESLPVSPFEVLEGERYDDLVRGPRRFFQYRYALRIIGEEYFGADVELPPLDVRYRIERSLDGESATAGRELTYLLPPEPVRVLALVPAGGADIRELPGETFGDAEARLFRANLAALGAAVLALAAVAAALAAALGLYRAREGTAAGAARLPVWRVADAALGELAAVRQVTDRDGWSAAEVGRALAAFRVAGAVALGRPPAQSAVEDRATVNHSNDHHHHHLHKDGDDGTGQLLVRRGGGRAGAAVRISSAVTPERLDRALPELRSGCPRDAHLAETARDALRQFGAVRYGRPADVPDASLTAQLDRAADALALRAREGAPAVRRIGALRRAAEAWERAWGR